MKNIEQIDNFIHKNVFKIIVVLVILMMSVPFVAISVAVKQIRATMQPTIRINADGTIEDLKPRPHPFDDSQNRNRRRRRRDHPMGDDDKGRRRRRRDEDDEPQ